MAGNIFDNPTLSIMYQDALQSLYNGCVMPWERDILAQAPLPSDMVDPFASEDVKPLSVMNLTYVSLSGWIADAKKEKYYSERFVQLSKLVMKGVSTMARGLVTLHQHGEELSAAPMQIDDLISVGSYHFRKSYLGVVQFSSKHPEIGERLLVNQLGWATTLMRLYKTKEKLAKPILVAGGQCSVTGKKDSGARIQDSGDSNSNLLLTTDGQESVLSLQGTAPGVASLSENEEGSTENKKSEIRNKELASNEEGRSKNEELLDDKADNSECFFHNSSLNEDSSFLTPHSSFSAPGRYGALQAYKPLENKKSEIRNKKSDGLGNEEKWPVVGDQWQEAQQSEIAAASFPENEEESTENKISETSENKKSEIRNKKSDGLGNEEKWPVAGDQWSEVQQNGTKAATLPENEEESTENKKSEACGDGYCAAALPAHKNCHHVRKMMNEDISPDIDPDIGPDSGESLTEQSHEGTDPDLPPYLQILQNVFGRSGPSENGELNFTFDEICFLAEDPEFNNTYPQSASQLRTILNQINSS